MFSQLKIINKINKNNNIKMKKLFIIVKLILINKFLKINN